ncbi:MAG: CBS domain-containing protein [Candidatus Nitrosotenuis sp.]
MQNIKRLLKRRSLEVLNPLDKIKQMLDIIISNLLPTSATGSDIMVKDLITVEPSMNIDELVNGYFLRYGYGGFPVVESGRYLGLITLKEIKDVPKEYFNKTHVSEVFSKHKKEWEISPEEDVLRALEKMIKDDTGRLVIIEGDRIVGMITRNGIARYVQIKESL